MGAGLAHTLAGKKIILAITGSIAAYKTPLLVRALILAGAEVQVLLTHSAASIVAPLTLSTLSNKPVLQSLVADDDTWHNHVALGYWADLLIIAPLSAHSLGRMANGLCDNIVEAVYLSAKCSVMVAPAMDSDMWQHPSVARNVKQLAEDGVEILPVGVGLLASGLSGPGRMMEPEHIVHHVFQFFSLKSSSPYRGKKALVTAGPTFEPLDPVRYLGNRSSGKMGLAICKALLILGFDVVLIAGPGVPELNDAALTRIDVQTADEMLLAATANFQNATIAVMTAAVADYRPATISASKLKKTDADDELTIQLKKNPDILASLGASKSSSQIVVGFALETHDGMTHALKKLEQKKADFIALNILTSENSVFGSDENSLFLLGAKGVKEDLGTLPKEILADKLIQRILALKPI